MLLTEPRPPPGPRHVADRPAFIRDPSFIRNMPQNTPRSLDAGVYLRIETWFLLQVLW